MESYLFHGIKWYDYDLLIKILESKYILPRCMLKEPLLDSNNIFNGTKYISLCQKSLGPDYTGAFRSSYDEFIFNKPCFVLENKSFDIIRTDIMSTYDAEMMSPEDWNKIIFNDGKIRPSYYIDEVQTKDKISLKDNLKAVGLPLRDIEKRKSQEELKNYLINLRNTLDKIDKEIPIVNSSCYDFGNGEECIKKYTFY